MAIKDRILYLAAAVVVATGLALVVLNGHRGARIGVDGNPPGVSAQSEAPVAAGGRAADFKLETLDGSTVSLNSLRGKVVFLNIWATWCEPCRTEMPQLDKLYRSRNLDGFVVLGISDESIEQQQAYITQVPITYPLLITTPGVPAFYREIAKYPAIFLIDRKGSLTPAPNQSQGFERVAEAVGALLSEGK